MTLQEVYSRREIRKGNKETHTQDQSGSVYNDYQEAQEIIKNCTPLSSYLSVLK